MEIKNYQAFKEEFAAIEVQLPLAKEESLAKNCQEAPVWIHFGGGNLFRGFHAEIAQKLADAGALTSGLVVCDTFDEQTIDLAYRPFDNNLLQVIMKEDGTLVKNLFNVVSESYFANPVRPEDYQKVEGIFKNDSLQLATFTITEKGYNIQDSSGELLPVIEQDIQNGPSSAKHTIAIVASLLHQRFLAGGQPIAMVSTDNFSHNGLKFKESILAVATGWLRNNFIDQAFIDYLSDEQKVSFPWSMVDRITPNPSETVMTALQKEGIQDAEMFHTEKHTNIASFVNTEETCYLVIEDNFPNGRPALEEAGVILTDRETVDKTDAMKVTTCLNPLHTALAVYGCLLNYSSIADEMKDDRLVALIEGIGYKEGLPVVEDPKIINPKTFIDEVLQKRLPNPMIPDTPQRIASDTSQKLAIRYGETIEKYMQQDDLNPQDLVYIPLVIAGWLRYLLAVDDNGVAFTPSPDPLLLELQTQLQGIKFASNGNVHEAVAPILQNKQIFGIDLYACGLGEKIEGYLQEMLTAGGIKATLQKYTESGKQKDGNDISLVRISLRQGQATRN